MTPFDPKERLLDYAGGRKGFLFEKKVGLKGDLRFERLGDRANLGLTEMDKVTAFINWDNEITVSADSLTAHYTSLGSCAAFMVDLGDFIAEVAKQEGDNETFLSDNEQVMMNLDETERLILGVVFNEDGSSEISITRWGGYPGPELSSVELFRTSFPIVTKSIGWRGKIGGLSSEIAVAVTSDQVSVSLIETGKKVFTHLAKRKIDIKHFDQAKKIGVVDKGLATELIKAALPTND